MRIATTVYLEHNETLADHPDEAAMKVLVALGGNPRKDSCELAIEADHAPGRAGFDPSTVPVVPGPEADPPEPEPEPVIPE